MYKAGLMPLEGVGIVGGRSLGFLAIDGGGGKGNLAEIEGVSSMKL